MQFGIVDDASEQLRGCHLLFQCMGMLIQTQSTDSSKKRSVVRNGDNAFESESSSSIQSMHVSASCSKYEDLAC